MRWLNDSISLLTWFEILRHYCVFFFFQKKKCSEGFLRKTWISLKALALSSAGLFWERACACPHGHVWLSDKHQELVFSCTKVLLTTTDLYSWFCQKQHSEKVFRKGQLSVKLWNILILLNYGTGTKEINWSWRTLCHFSPWFIQNICVSLFPFPYVGSAIWGGHSVFQLADEIG